MKIKKNKRKIFIRKRGKGRLNLKKNLKKLNILKLLIIFIFIFVFFEINKNNKYNKTYFSCFVSVGKLENKYSRELVEHYLSIGVEKFYLGDDNSLDGEKLSDVLQDYIDKKIVEIKDVRGSMNQVEFYEYILIKYYNKCKWFLNYDFDEFLEFKDKNMKIQDYLSLDIFNKCDVIKIHWLMFYDNDLVHYDNRSLKERFPIPNKNTFENYFHKSIVRGRKYNGTMWVTELGTHQPNESLAYVCNNEGKFLKHTPGILEYPNYEYGFIRHYSMKTAEEFATKIIRGNLKKIKYNYEEIIGRINRFFKYNTFTEEKLSVIEKITNMTFPQYHKKNSFNQN